MPLKNANNQNIGSAELIDYFELMPVGLEDSLYFWLAILILLILLIFGIASIMVKKFGKKAESKTNAAEIFLRKLQVAEDLQESGDFYKFGEIVSQSTRDFIDANLKTNTLKKTPQELESGMKLLAQEARQLEFLETKKDEKKSSRQQKRDTELLGRKRKIEALLQEKDKIIKMVEDCEQIRFADKTLKSQRAQEILNLSRELANSL